ncbi:hypothetical protein [Clostridium perfringens]|uniref:hypothetical protein n=1 Tax=Clostridium perfringens TaxID=1502 RepID=UPI003C6C37F2
MCSCLNTSYVSVQLYIINFKVKVFSCLNTSYVSVQLDMLCKNADELESLNTSYVSVQRNFYSEKDTIQLLFKYILCYYSTIVK